MESSRSGAHDEYQYVELDHSYGDGSIGIYYKTGEYGGRLTGRGVNERRHGSLWGIGIGHSLGGGAHRVRRLPADLRGRT